MLNLSNSKLNLTVIYRNCIKKTGQLVLFIIFNIINGPKKNSSILCPYYFQCMLTRLNKHSEVPFTY